jgi:hypothetical protein
MNNPIVPDWIKKIKADDEKKDLIAEKEAWRRLAGEKAIKADGPEFWKQLLKELKITVDGLASIEIQASVADCGSKLSSEESYRITLTAGSFFPRHIYIDLFYSPGAPHIRCCLLGGNPFSLNLYWTDEGRIALFYDGRMLNPADAAQAIVNPLVLHVRGKN